MWIDIIETPSLGDRSYLVSEFGTAVVIDPPRDVDRVLAVADERAVLISHVVETHLHEDHVSGGLELARAVDAAYVLPAGARVGFERMTVGDGDVLRAGRMSLRGVHTPGHTRHHLSYILTDADGRVRAAFTGGSMLDAAVGRTDLDGPQHAIRLSRAQFHSVRRLATSLPAPTAVYPAHGYDDRVPAASIGRSTTIAEQLIVNPAMRATEDAFVEQLLHGLCTPPGYYDRVASINAAGPPPAPLAELRWIAADELVLRLAGDEWVVDLRPPAVFAAGHLPGALNFPLSNDFPTCLGWLYDEQSPLTLIGVSRRQIGDAQRELCRIGIDRLAGAAVGLVGGIGQAAYPVSDYAGLAAALSAGPVQVLDTRRHDERRAGGIAGARHIPIHELPHRLDEVPDEEVWVHSSTGYRAAIGASILARAGRRVVLVDGRYDDPVSGAAAQGLCGGVA